MFIINVENSCAFVYFCGKYHILVSTTNTFIQQGCIKLMQVKVKIFIMLQKVSSFKKLLSRLYI